MNVRAVSDVVGQVSSCQGHGSGLNGGTSSLSQGEGCKCPNILRVEGAADQPSNGISLPRGSAIKPIKQVGVDGQGPRIPRYFGDEL